MFQKMVNQLRKLMGKEVSEEEVRRRGIVRELKRKYQFYNMSFYMKDYEEENEIKKCFPNVEIAFVETRNADMSIFLLEELNHVWHEILLEETADMWPRNWCYVVSEGVLYIASTKGVFCKTAIEKPFEKMDRNDTYQGIIKWKNHILLIAGEHSNKLQRDRILTVKGEKWKERDCGTIYNIARRTTKKYQEEQCFMEEGKSLELICCIEDEYYSHILRDTSEVYRQRTGFLAPMEYERISINEVRLENGEIKKTLIEWKEGLYEILYIADEIREIIQFSCYVSHNKEDDYSYLLFPNEENKEIMIPKGTVSSAQWNEEQFFKIVYEEGVLLINLKNGKTKQWEIPGAIDVSISDCKLSTGNKKFFMKYQLIPMYPKND